jgi:hypothetical protein
VTTTNTTPVVGDAATYSVGSDSYPATVVKVSPSGHRVTLQDDSWKVTSGSMMDGSADFKSASRLTSVTRRADGKYRLVGWDRGVRLRLPSHVPRPTSDGDLTILKHNSGDTFAAR